jgi:hypothetical protein
VDNSVMSGFGSDGVISRTITCPSEIIFSICMPSRVPRP